MVNYGKYIKINRYLQKKSISELCDGICTPSTLSKIENNKSNINPKIINNKDYSCTYCKFKDICFKRKENEIKLGGEEDEMDTGTITSN